jgi:hypothetical protein
MYDVTCDQQIVHWSDKLDNNNYLRRKKHYQGTNFSNYIVIFKKITAIIY